jgi:cupin 2 domain-containing protein
VRNLLRDVPSSLPDELVETLLEADGFRLERIVSLGHTTPAGEWYDQERQEWVVLLTGSAGLRFADRDDVVEMRPGDHVVIAAHRRHRVEWTDASRPTIWLALHYD